MSKPLVAVVVLRRERAVIVALVPVAFVKMRPEVVATPVMDALPESRSVVERFVVVAEPAVRVVISASPVAKLVAVALVVVEFVAMRPPIKASVKEANDEKRFVEVLLVIVPLVAMRLVNVAERALNTM